MKLIVVGYFFTYDIFRVYKVYNNCSMLVAFTAICDTKSRFLFYLLNFKLSPFLFRLIAKKLLFI